MKLTIYGGTKDFPIFKAHGERDTEGVVACPFCGGVNIEVSNSHTPSYRGECQECGAQGPSNEYPKREAQKSRSGVRRQHQRAFARALELWNLRQRRF